MRRTFLSFDSYASWLIRSLNVFLVLIFLLNTLVYRFNFHCVWSVNANACYSLDSIMLISVMFSTILVIFYFNATMWTLYMVDSCSF